MKDLYLVGAGGMGREVISMIQDVHTHIEPRWNIKGFLDDTEDPLKNKACDYQVVGTIKDYYPKKNDVLLMCIANPKAKQEIATMLTARGAKFDSFISPWTNLGRHCSFGEGVIIYSGFGMTVNVQIGDFVTLLACGLGHDVIVGDYSTISARAALLGNVNVNKKVFIADSAIVSPNVVIGEDAYVGLGSVVVKNVKTGEKVFGNPAREIGI